MAPAPAPALDVDGEGGGANGQNTVKSDVHGELATPPVMPVGGGPVPGEFRPDGPVVAVPEDGIDSSDDPAPVIDVGGEGKGKGKGEADGGNGVLESATEHREGDVGNNLGDVVLKSATEHCEGEGALLAPCSEPSGADPVGGASSSYDPPPVGSSGHVTDERGGDTTECSSSFADSLFETDDEAGNEVSSPFSVHDDEGQSSLLPRRKKVSAEWKNDVRPMLWRFQWLELRMKELSSQVSKYDRQLALIEQEKELQQAINKTNGSRIESGKSCKGHENISMVRRNRKRHEDTADTSSYLKKHQILSYFFDKDKQNKGAETDGLIIEDDSHGPVGDGTKGRANAASLHAPKEYDVVSEQFMLHKVLMKIGDIQSQVHHLQEHLSKARTKQVKLSSLLAYAQVNGTEKRQRTQKRSFSYKNDRSVKPQKKKNLNILLEQEDRPALAVIPTSSERATGCLIEVSHGNGEEKAGERSQSHKKAITADLLLGFDSSLPNGHICNENTDDILIDNRGAKVYEPFENVEHSQEKLSALTENVAKTAPSKADNTSAQVGAEKISVPVVKKQLILENQQPLKHVYSGKKRGRQPKTEGTGSAAASKEQSEQASKAPAAKQCKTGNSSLAAKKLKTGNSSSASKNLNTGNSSSATQNLETGNSSPFAKKQKTGNSSSNAKKQAAGYPSAASTDASGNTPTNMRIEKAVLVEVNSRRSQRARKPKVY